MATLQFKLNENEYTTITISNDMYKEAKALPPYDNVPIPIDVKFREGIQTLVRYYPLTEYKLRSLNLKLFVDMLDASDFLGMSETYNMLLQHVRTELNDSEWLDIYTGDKMAIIELFNKLNIIILDDLAKDLIKKEMIVDLNEGYISSNVDGNIFLFGYSFQDNSGIKKYILTQGINDNNETVKNIKVYGPYPYRSDNINPYIGFASNNDVYVDVSESPFGLRDGIVNIDNPKENYPDTTITISLDATKINTSDDILSFPDNKVLHKYENEATVESPNLRYSIIFDENIIVNDIVKGTKSIYDININNINNYNYENLSSIHVIFSPSERYVAYIQAYCRIGENEVFIIIIDLEEGKIVSKGHLNNIPYKHDTISIAISESYLFYVYNKDRIRQLRYIKFSNFNKTHFYPINTNNSFDLLHKFKFNKDVVELYTRPNKLIVKELYPNPSTKIYELDLYNNYIDYINDNMT